MHTTTSTDHHNTVLSLTTRLAVSIRYLPKAVDWSNSKPQGRRADLTEEHILPSPTDGIVIRDRGVRYIMELLVTELSGLNRLKKYVLAERPPHPIRKSLVTPQKYCIWMRNKRTLEGQKSCQNLRSIPSTNSSG